MLLRRPYWLAGSGRRYAAANVITVQARTQHFGHTKLRPVSTVSTQVSKSHGKSRLPQPLQDELLFHQTHTRHLLRGILRECTYFPDPFAGEWVRQQTLSQYRTYEYRVRKNFSDEAFRKKLELVRRKARQAMYQMQHANEGDKKMLSKALHMAYGRTGRRRHELMAPLLPIPGEAAAPDSAEIPIPAVGTTRFHEAIRETVESKSKTTKETGPVKAQIRAFIDNLPSQLKALLESQIRAAPPPLTRRNPRKLTFEIPERNTWYKPMPQSRVRNKIKEHYAKLLDQVQVPLPAEDWQRLHDLASGKTSFKLPIERRKGIAQIPTALEMTVMKGKVDKQVFRKDHVRTVTPRLMRRLWATVFEQCPLMKYDGEKQKWDVTWGVHALHSQGSATVRLSDSDPRPIATQEDTTLAVEAT